ncbi:MAG: hypothetical protein ACREM3_10985 [Candidatus Rokuibacteriota bacterium]
MNDGRLVVTDSLTLCDRVDGADVIVAGSFAGVLSFQFVLPSGPRGLIAHEAGVGLDRAGISGLPLADRCGVPAAAVASMSARLGDGRSVHEDGILSHVNATAAALGLRAGLAARDAARLLLAAPPGRPGSGVEPVDRSAHVVLEAGGGRVVLLGSTSFTDAGHARDVIVAGSHGGRVNARPLLAVRPRGVISNDGGMARDRSGADGLPVLDAIGVAGATVDAMTARIGDPASAWERGVISAVNETAARAGVAVGQTAREAACSMLGQI